MQSSPQWTPPSEFDDYLLVQLLGRGGLGHVYLAQDTVLARHVAIKFVAHLDPSPQVRERFLVEARAAARVHHPNVVSLFRVGELYGQPYLVSEFVRGKTLDQLDKPLPWKRTLEIGVDLARGLAAAHRKGVLHCDLKPSNAILAEDGSVKIFDFGLATLLEGRAEDSPASTASAGVRMGTPTYVAPEIWHSSPPSRQSDIYALGALLFVLAGGRSPFAGVSDDDLPQVATTREPAPLGEVAADIDPRFAAIVDRCLRRDPAGRYASGDELREALEQLARSSDRAPIPSGNPYRGLRPFDAEHKSLFFGRESEIGVVLDRLRAEPLVVVAGDSGSGKSSLCRAGVLPLVVEGALGLGRSWSAVATAPGKRPAIAVAAALAPLLESTEEDVVAAIEDDPDELGRSLHRRLGNERGLVVFLDQLEELETLAPSTEAALVEDLIGRLAGGIPAIRVLATLRADFLTRMVGSPSLGPDVARGLYILPPLSREAIREVVVGPAQATGVRFESEELVGALVDAPAEAHGALPLLQFALAELWQRRDREHSMITASALESLGGVAGALARHADAALESLVPAQRETARRILSRLVTAGGTRARRTTAELIGVDPAAPAVLDALVRNRLLVAHQAEDGSAFELAHEVLIEGWGTLRRWLHQDEEVRLVRERLGRASAEWERLDRAGGALWSAPQLAESSPLETSDLSRGELAFLAASRRAVRRRRWTVRGLIVALPIIAVLSYLGVELKARIDMRERVDARARSADAILATARQKDREAARVRGIAFAHFDNGENRRGERAWTRVLSLRAEAVTTYLRAGTALEAALALDPGRTDVRATLADALLDRAFLEERARRFGRRDELVQRLALYDRDGSRMRRWNAPATLRIASVPAGATVTLSRYVSQNGRLRERRVRELGRTPVARLSIPRGSYLVSFELRGRYPVRYPILLDRGEHFDVRVDLPPLSAVPKGFVYIPPGRFLFGSAADEQIRKGFFETSPLRPSRTGGFIIGRNEVTFADWLAYLADLPPWEKRLRTPGVARKAAGSTAALRLEQILKTWRLTIRPAQRTYSAREGERIQYAGRTHNASQDWLRFPVTAISAQDARAYTAWLRRTGRVKGARLCTEYEWERAARGADARTFPHGDRLESNDANFDATYDKNPLGMGPTEVGAHPRGKSPFGLYDMSGNAWEWTVSAVGPKQYIVRGGAYFYGSKTNQSVNRQVSVPTLRDATLGLRICASSAGLR